MKNKICLAMTPASTYKRISRCLRPSTSKRGNPPLCTVHRLLAEAGRPLEYAKT